MWTGFWEVLIIGILVAPIVLLVGWIFDLGRWVIIPSGALTALFALLLVAASIVGKTQKRAESKHAPEYPRIAAANGFRYDEEVPALVRELPFHPFDVMTEGTARYVVRGRVGAGHPFAIFRYAGKWDNSELEGMVVVVALPSAVPELQIEPTWEIGKATRAARRTPVLLEDDRFNQRFRLQTYDHSPTARKYAVDVLNPRAMQLQLAAPGDLWWTIESGYLYVVSNGVLLDPDILTKHIAWARTLGAIVDTVPTFVWEQGRPARTPPSLAQV